MMCNMMTGSKEKRHTEVLPIDILEKEVSVYNSFAVCCKVNQSYMYFELKVVDFLPPYLLDHLTAFMAPMMDKDVFQFLKPFHTTLWIWIILTVVMFAVVKLILSSINQKQGNYKKRDIFSKLEAE